MRKLHPLSLLSCCVLAACSVLTPAPLQTVYDLGPAPAARVPAPVQLVEVSAPSWMNGPAMAYRLDYSDPLQRQSYRDSRWVAPPAELLAERLRQRLEPRGAPRPLRLDLESFEQQFSTVAQSEVRIRVRATLGGPTGLQRVFEVHQAAGADAASGVRALALASDVLVADVLGWAAEAP
jgi:ABC-type uncharacterized transport system auxiliary subunit